MASIQVTYEQFRHRAQDVEDRTVTYKSYEEAVAGACSYLEERRGRFPNEVFEVNLYGGDRYDEHLHSVTAVADVKADMLAHSNAITVEGKICMVNLTLDGTTNYGAPHLQRVTISSPALVEAKREAARAERLATYGLCDGCGDPDCDHDCGMLPCGCIDTCRCGWDRDDSDD
jgi:hypothetical protein